MPEAAPKKSDSGPSRTTLVVGILAAVATVGAAIGGSYLGSKSAADTTRDQLAYENRRHQYDVRKDAYARLAQALDRYIVRAGEVPTHRTGARRHLLTRDDFAARAAFAEAWIVGTEAVVDIGLDAITELEKIDVDASKTDDATVRASVDTAKRWWDAFIDAAKRDLDRYLPVTEREARRT